MDRSWGEPLRVGDRFASGNLELYLLPVVGQAHVCGKVGIGCVVIEIVAHVGEEGSLRLQLFDDGDRLVEVRVTGVGIATQGIDDEYVQILQQGNTDLGDVAHVGEVGGAAE